MYQDKPETVPVRDLLCDYHHIQIPDYQRHYTWEADNVVQFFEDIIYDVNQFYDKKRSSVFGTIIGMLEPASGKKESNKERDHIFTIIDGQQRISTLTMFIVCLAHYAKKYSEEDSTLEYELGPMRSYIIKDNTSVHPEPRIIFNYTDRDYWATLIDKVYNRNSPTCGMLRESLKDMDVFVGKENNDTRLHAGLKAMLSTLGDYLNRSKKGNEKIRRLWDWINSIEFGMRFTKIVESDIHTALMRFDRENNRGVRVTMDDLAKSYLIEAVERSDAKESVKNSKKLKILEHWKTFQRDSKGLNKEKIIQWYLGMRTGYWGIGGPDSNGGRTLMAKIFRQNLDINPLERYPDTEKESWDPVTIAEEIAKWVNTYQEIIKNRDMTHEKTYYNVMFLRELRSPWPFLVALSIACQKDVPMETETSEICNLPMEMVAELEYYVISQVLTKSYKQNKWADKYRVWAGWLGRHHYDLDYNTVKLRTTKNVTKEGTYNGNTVDHVISEILDDMRKLNEELVGEQYADFEHFLETYEAGAQAGNLSGGQFDSRKRAAHVRILKQAEYSLSKEKVANLLDNKKKGLHLEHIFPNDIKNWKKDSLYSNEEISLLGTVKQHIGNHALVSERFNVVMGNRKFREKQFGKKEEGDEESIECYANSALRITSSLSKTEISKWTPDLVKERGNVLLSLWAENGPRIVANNIKKNYDVNILEPNIDQDEKSIYRLLNSDESSSLEFKAGYFYDKGGKVQVGKITNLMARVNATINAFANTNGGDLIIGKQDSSKNDEDVVGINNIMTYFENEAVANGKNKGHGRELFQNQLSMSVRSFYNYKKYPINFVIKLEELRNSKWVVHIEVKEFDKEKGPVPYFHPLKHATSRLDSKIYFFRHAAQNVTYNIKDSKPPEDGKNHAKEQILVISEDIDDEIKSAVIGPFKSANSANKYTKDLYNRCCIDEANIPNRSRISNISFNSRPDLGQICDGMFRTPGLKYENSEGKRACWIINLVNLPEDWDLEYKITRPGYTPGSISHHLK